jgi:arginase
MFPRINFNNFRCMFGQKKYGVQYGGDMIIKHMNFKKDNINNIDITNYKNYGLGYNIINNNLKNNIFNLNLGGDHSIAASTIRPLVDRYNKDLLVIWIDAHADINTFRSSHTQNIHGMPLSALMGIMDHWYKPPFDKNEKYKSSKLVKKNLIYVGIRDLDDFEEKLLERKKFIFYRNFTNKLIDTINSHPAKYIHISCDIDGLDPTIMPSTGTQSPDGLLLDHVFTIIENSKKRLISFDLVEFNPMIGSKKDQKVTLENIEKIIQKVL